MSEAVATTRARRGKAVIWLSVAVALAFLVAANVHLFYVASTSQPDCVAHVRQGEGDAERRVFSAAQSSCSPR